MIVQKWAQCNVQGVYASFYKQSTINNHYNFHSNTHTVETSKVDYPDRKTLNAIPYIPVYGHCMPIYGSNLSQYCKMRECIQAFFALWYTTRLKETEFWYQATYSIQIVFKFKIFYSSWTDRVTKNDLVFWFASTESHLCYFN